MRYRESTLSAVLLASLVSASASAAPPPPAPVTLADVHLEPFVDRVEALGTLRANEMVVLTANVTEQVTAIHFDDGRRVHAGELLVELTNTEEKAALQEARAAEEEAKAQYERVKPLAAQGSAAKSVYDERLREWETAKARLAVAQSRLEDRLVKAPFAGVVGLRNISVGALVRPGDVITTLDDDAVMKLEFHVPATYIETLRPGLAIVARARAYEGRDFRGQVRSVDSRVDPVTRSVIARAEIPNPDRVLRPGMLMSVELLKKPRDALVIPESAVVPSGRKTFVFRVDDAAGGKAQRREVRLGSRRQGEVEVLEGLAAGDRVVSHGTQRVRDGQPVTVVPGTASP
ncbi:MAG: efflux RND transporter periplasmic adaptor subunit [Gammaproteobacteria bacterium]|jgi:membrane fusion protein (multidrug efflux system)|nr:efflux RND transporter periplasmic adaptor subunit [Gammaproteobacteria bacterium]